MDIGGDVVGRDKIVNIYNPQETGLTSAVSRILEYVSKASEVDTNRRFFVDHVEPIYRDLRIVVNDYQEIISDLEDQLASALPIDLVIRKLVVRREKYALTRDEIIRYSNALRSQRVAKQMSNLENARAGFERAILDLLTAEPATGTTGGQIRTKLISLIADFESLLAKEAPPREYFRLLNDYSMSIRYCWERVVDSYIELRIECLK